VLLTGASGQVGRALLVAAPAAAQLHALTHAQLDISDATAVGTAVHDFQPDIILNAAAYTAVDRAESEPALAQAINARGPRNLAEAARASPRCRLIHISTDYVFDGSSPEPYRPEDRPHPLSVYGRSKLEGEQAVFEVLAERAVVLRTAWVYAAQGKNFLSTMLRLMRERGEVRVVADQRGAPTAAASVARALWALALRADLGGVLHWTDAGVASWYQFACAIAEEGLAAGLLARAAQVTAITTSEYPTPAQRPANSVLDLSESAQRLALMPTPWRDSLRGVLAELAPG
jgi:dTDP-4-dehydrorhamnose reductase